MMHQKDSNENSPLLIAIDFLLDLKIKPTVFITEQQNLITLKDQPIIME